MHVYTQVHNVPLLPACAIYCFWVLVLFSVYSLVNSKYGNKRCYRFQKEFIVNLVEEVTHEFSHFGVWLKSLGPTINTSVLYSMLTAWQTTGSSITEVASVT